MSTPFVVMCAPNGARRTKDDHPALPLTPAEIAAEAERCADAGAALLHLHVRDTAGRHSLSPELYREAIKLGADDLQEDLALACYYAEDWRGGAEAFVKAFEADGDADMMYNAACCAALGAIAARFDRKVAARACGEP